MIDATRTGPQRSRAIVALAAMALLMGACSSGGSHSVTARAGARPATDAPSGPPRLPPAIHDETRTSGIIDSAQAPFPSATFSVTNQYSGPFGNGQWVNVYVGQKLSADGASLGGAVRVYVGPADPSSDQTVRYIGEFLVPNAPDWVSIVSVDGSRLSLKRKDGSAVNFDVSSDQFS